ncbi:MAG TPA: hypothetical protein VH062_21130 [Polyangiaceae bacterium]|jgi:hypothetical protein|nr:hypothetical protein [Polyangiaceae bacterium]
MDNESRGRLICALIARGWRLHEGAVHAPLGTMWLSTANPWQGDLSDMLDRMKARLERIQQAAPALPEDAAAGTASCEDTAELVDILANLVSS